MSQTNTLNQKKLMDPLLRNQMVGGICASLVVIFAFVRIFILKASLDGVFANLISITGTVLSLVVLTSAVRIILSAKKTQSFEEVILEECRKIDQKYGALIQIDDACDGTTINGTVYMIADNVDAIFTSDPEQWGNSLHFREKFAFSKDFSKTHTLYYYVNNTDMSARAARLGESHEITARLLARDTAVAIQRGFSDILTAHALDIRYESDRALVTIFFNSAETVEDANRITELVNYLLFLHFVTT